MKAIVLLFDSLRRDHLPPYGGDWVKAPNFRRLAERAATFDACCMGSMPCMPARRELHTGRYNFLHRAWGPLEPFDDSLPELLRARGVYSHLVTDHLHYWEDGGATYHTRYDTWDCIRGQEGDPWKPEVGEPDVPPHLGGRDGMPLWRQDWINRKYLASEADTPIARVFAGAEEFLRTNRNANNWLLQIENFTPHEPFRAPAKYLDLYPNDYAGPHFEWPDYATVKEDPAAVRHLRKRYAAAVSMSDAYLGQLLDVMDELDLWRDTMLIVTTDHGFLLGEHGRWGKRVCSNYTEIALLPLFVWDPRSDAAGARRQSLVQLIDIPATLLDYFGAAVPPDMQGKPLAETVRADAPVREAALFGVFGGEVNCTDGRWVYMRAPRGGGDAELYNYTLMPMYMASRFKPAELAAATVAPPFAFTKGCFTLRVKAPPFLKRPFLEYEPMWTRLYDTRRDPKQEQPVNNPAEERRMLGLLVGLMRETDAPREQYARLGIVEEHTPS